MTYVLKSNQTTTPNYYEGVKSLSGFTVHSFTRDISKAIHYTSKREANKAAKNLHCEVVERK